MISFFLKSKREIYFHRASVDDLTFSQPAASTTTTSELPFVVLFFVESKFSFTSNEEKKFNQKKFFFLEKRFLSGFFFCLKLKILKRDTSSTKKMKMREKKIKKTWHEKVKKNCERKCDIEKSIKEYIFDYQVNYEELELQGFLKLWMNLKKKNILCNSNKEEWNAHHEWNSQSAIFSHSQRLPSLSWESSRLFSSEEFFFCLSNWIIKFLFNFPRIVTQHHRLILDVSFSYMNAKMRQNITTIK